MSKVLQSQKASSLRTSMGQLLDPVNRNKLRALQQRVPQRKRHTPTPLGNVRRSAVPFLAYIDRSCPPPIIEDKLVVTRAWALGCFLPAYWSARNRVRTDPSALAASVSGVLINRWLDVHTVSPAAKELERRIRLAVAVLLRQDGHDVEMPEEPSYPPPSTPVYPPWVRALMTGWP